MNTHAPGIYFGMPSPEYHADPSLSSSGTKRLAAGPMEFWRNSPMNPDRDPEEQTVATLLGTANHCRLLEGEDTFYQRYASKLSKEDHPDALFQGDDLRAWCKAHDLKVSGTNDELCARIAAADPDVKLWPRMVSQHGAANAGKILLDAKTIHRIEAAVRIISDAPDIARAMEGGYREVSLFWVDPETSVPMKARIDLLKPRTAVDLKTFSNTRMKPVDQAVTDAIAYNGYGTQAVIYSHGIEEVKALLRAGKAVISGEPEPQWLADFIAAPTTAYVLIFLESCSYPATRIRQLSRTSPDGGPSLYWQKGERAFRAACAVYADYMANLGPDTPWVDTKEMTTLSDTELPLWSLD